MKPLLGLAAAVVLAVLAPSPAWAAPERCPAQVRVSLPNFEVAPFLLGTDNVEAKPGLLIEWVRTAIERTGCKAAVTIQRLPPNRQLADMRNGRIDVLPGFAYGVDLARDLAYPMQGAAVNRNLAMMVDTVSLYARTDDSRIAWDGKRLLPAHARVGSSTGGGLTAELAQKNGWTVELAQTPQANLRKLVARRVDVIMEPDVVLLPYLASAEGRGAQRLAPPLHITPRFTPVRLGFARDYPGFTRKFWLETCRESRRYFTTMPACR